MEYVNEASDYLQNITMMMMRSRMPFEVFAQLFRQRIWIHLLYFVTSTKYIENEQEGYNLIVCNLLKRDINLYQL